MPNLIDPNLRKKLQDYQPPMPGKYPPTAIQPKVNPIAPWMGQLPSYAPWLQQGTPAQNLMQGVQGLTGGYEDFAKRTAMAASQPFRPEPTEPSQRPPTPEEKGRGVFAYQSTGAEEKAYEEWEAPSISTEGAHLFKLPWTPEDTKPWELSVKTPLEELAYLPLWMTGGRGATAPAKAALGAIEKRTPQAVRTALREEAGVLGRAKTPTEEVVNFVHYGREPGVTKLSPKFHGTGIAGTEKRTAAEYPELFQERLYAYKPTHTKDVKLSENMYIGTLKKDKILQPNSEEATKVWSSLRKRLEAGGYSLADKRAATEMRIKLAKEAGYEAVDLGENGFIILSEQAVKEVPRGLAKNIVAAHQVQGGSTYSLGAKEAKKGYALSVNPERTMSIPSRDLQEAQVLSFMSKNVDLLGKPNKYVGTWYDDVAKTTELDVVTVEANINKATMLAEEHGQKAIFDLGTNTEIRTTLGAAQEAAAPYIGLPLRERAIKKLTDVLKIEKPLMRETKELQHIALRAKAARIGRALEATGEPESVLTGAGKLRAGKLPAAKGERSLRTQIEPEETSELFGMIKEHPTLRGFEKLDTTDAFVKLLDTNQRLTKSEIKLLSEVFGPEFAARFRTLGQRVVRGLLEGAGLLRGLVASGELSATLRQGAPLLSRRPYLFPGMMKEQAKYLFSAKNLEKADALMKAHPKFKLWVESKGYTAPIPGKAAALWKAEETFMSNWFRHIPVIAQTERAYVGGLNWLRFNSFLHGEKLLTKQGLATEESLQGLAKLINLASGRGEAKFLNSEIGPVLNALLFSPRYQLSRMQLPKMLFSSNKAVSKEAWKMMASHLAFGTSVISALVLAGGEFEIDPRSSDFGKVKIGETRLDFWSGFAQYTRFVAQLASNQRKKTTTGEIVDLNRFQTMIRFGQSKLSPAAGLINDIMTGQTFLGEEMAWDEETMQREAFRRTVPFWWQDMVDAITEEGLLGGLVASPGFLGVGVVTHTPLEGPGAKQSMPQQITKQIEDGIYSRYPANVRQQLEQLKSLESSDKAKAREFLYQHPELMSIRMEIAQAKQQALTQQGQGEMQQRQTEMQQAMQQRQAEIRQKLGGG